jgi:hypothetical protein
MVFIIESIKFIDFVAWPGQDFLGEAMRGGKRG